MKMEKEDFGSADSSRCHAPFITISPLPGSVVFSRLVRAESFLVRAIDDGP
jgi:hypothetical protein